MGSGIRLIVAGLTCFLLPACGGGPGASHGPAPDFALSVSPSSLSVAQGYTSSAVTVSVTAKNGFGGSVSVTITGLPEGVTSSPASPFTVAAGASHQGNFSLPAPVAPASYTVLLAGTGGRLSHSVQLTLTVTETVITTRTYQEGSMLYLETVVGNETSRVGLESLWGGTVVEVRWNGTNFVNRYDTGREVQAALYDGNDTYGNYWDDPPVYGWDPVQGGDKYVHGSPLLDQAFPDDSIYIKTQPYEWSPDGKGGGPGQPVLTDTYFEQTVSAVPNHPRAFKLHYRISHFGAHEHAYTGQELPAIYVNLGFDRFVYYTGNSPWTNGTVSFATPPPDHPAGSLFYTPEQWAGLVDDRDVGLTVYVPGHYPYFGGLVSFAGSPGPTGFGTIYFTPAAQFAVGPNGVLESDIYLIAGDYKAARQAIYDLKATVTPPDIFPPLGCVDIPTPSSQVAGTVEVAGWTFDNVGVSKVEVFVDDVLAGAATYGTSRPDVPTVWPSAPVECGFQYQLDTTPYPNGPHNLKVRVTDTSGNVAAFPQVPITVGN